MNTRTFLVSVLMITLGVLSQCVHAQTEDATTREMEKKLDLMVLIILDVNNDKVPDWAGTVNEWGVSEHKDVIAMWVVEQKDPERKTEFEYNSKWYVVRPHMHTVERRK